MAGSCRIHAVRDACRDTTASGTARGRAELGIDCAKVDDMIVSHARSDHVGGMHSAFGRIRDLAAARELILPGHDPRVMERLRRVADGIVEL